MRFATASVQVYTNGNHGKFEALGK